MNKSSIVNLNGLRHRNMLSLLRVLLERAPLSRIELAQLTGCDNTTVTRGVRELLERGLILTAGKQDVKHGRPREQLIINPDGKYLLGISLEPVGIYGQLTDFRGEPRNQRQVVFASNRSRNDYLTALEELTRSLLAGAQDRLAGIGVATFGTSLDAEGAIIHNTANFPELKNFDLRAFFQEKFLLTPRFADMMLCNMNDELNRHQEERHGNTMLVHLGHGIGMALAINGTICFQRNQHCGELGHNICVPQGEQCRCGRRGCLETICAIDNILAHLQERTSSQHTPTLEEAIFLYQHGDATCQKLLAEVQHYLAITLANQVNNLSPDHLVISGSLLGFGPQFCAELETQLRELLFEFSSRALDISFRESGEEGRTATGAALLARTHLLDTLELFEK